MFGSAPAPQNERTAFQPRSPYAAAKVYAYWMVANYRQGYNLFACNGVLFNHESPRRGETFVTRKITHAVARILAGQQDKVYLGNLEASAMGVCARICRGHVVHAAARPSRRLRHRHRGDACGPREFVEAGLCLCRVRLAEVCRD